MDRLHLKPSRQKPLPAVGADTLTLLNARKDTAKGIGGLLKQLNVQVTDSKGRVRPVRLMETLIIRGASATIRTISSIIATGPEQLNLTESCGEIAAEVSHQKPPGLSTSSLTRSTANHTTTTILQASNERVTALAIFVLRFFLLRGVPALCSESD